jgi:hypothetical protein
LLEQPVKEQATTPGAASVEAERELVEVGVEVLGSDGPAVGAKQQRLSRLATRWTPASPLSGIVLGAHDRPLRS